MKTPNVSSDEALVLLCQRELPYITTSFERLVAKHEKMIFHLCVRYLKNTDDAEDALQEIFIKTYHSIGQFKGEAQFKTWLSTIAINHCKKQLSRARPSFVSNDEAEFESKADEKTLSPEAETSGSERKECIERVIEILPEKERDVIVMRFISDLSLEEISNQIDAKLSATKMRFYRALEKFKTMYEKHCT